MVELELYSRTTTATMATIARPDELLHVVRDRSSSGCLRLRTDCNRRLRGRNSLLLALMSSDEESVNLILSKVVTV